MLEAAVFLFVLGYGCAAVLCGYAISDRRWVKLNQDQLKLNQDLLDTIYRLKAKGWE